jgi:hypothetical protein
MFVKEQFERTPLGVGECIENRPQNNQRPIIGSRLSDTSVQQLKERV